MIPREAAIENSNTVVPSTYSQQKICLSQFRARSVVPYVWLVAFWAFSLQRMESDSCKPRLDRQHLLRIRLVEPPRCCSRVSLVTWPQDGDRTFRCGSETRLRSVAEISVMRSSHLVISSSCLDGSTTIIFECALKTGSTHNQDRERGSEGRYSTTFANVLNPFEEV